jgi:hypothetical protein
MNKYENDLTHIRQMMGRQFLIFFLVFAARSITAQEFTIGYSYAAIVTAKSGVNLRDASSTTSNKILNIPYNSRITIVSYDTSHSAIIEDVKGYWMHAQYNEKEGYIFSGFLEIQNCLDGIFFTVIADSILVDNDIFTTSCAPYLGFYELKSDQFETEFIIKPVKMVSVDAPDYYRSNILKIADGQPKPIFMFSGLPINKTTIKGRLLNDNMLFPSEILFIGHDKTSDFVAYAKGKGIENNNKFRPNIFSEIEKYQVWIRKIDKVNYGFVDYLTQEMTLKGVDPYGYEGGVRFYWIGDLNDDNIPDIIYKESTHYAGWNCVLLLSPTTRFKRFV